MAAANYGFKDKAISLVREAGSTVIWASWSNDNLVDRAKDSKYTKKTKVKKETRPKGSYARKRKEFSYRWYYKDAVNHDWLPSSNSDSTVGKNETKISYNIPSNAVLVGISIKPVMYPTNKKAKKVADKVYECPKFDPRWVSYSVKKTYDAADPQTEDLTPAIITSISSNIDKHNVLVLSTNISADEVNKKSVTQVDFEIRKSTNVYASVNSYTYFTSTTATVVDRKASFAKTLDAGYYYIYRARAKSATKTGNWSDWSDHTDKILSGPTTPVWTADPKGTTSTTVQLGFKVNGYVEEYEIEYAIKALYLSGDSGLSQTVTRTESSPEASTRNVTVYIDNLESGNTYYFQIRAKSSKFDPTGWSEVRSITIGRPPAAPTTYSSKTTAKIGDKVYLYWVHNTQDGSSQQDAQIALYINQTTTMLGGAVITVKNPHYDDQYDYLKDKTLNYDITLGPDSIYDKTNTSKKYSFVDGDTLYWKIRTRGTYTGGSNSGYGDWSAIRKITMFAPPTANLHFKTGWLWDPLDLRDHTIPLNSLPTATVIDKYPYVVEMWADPPTQEAVSFNLTISNAGGAYETENAYGELITVGKDEIVYQKYFDANINPENGNYYFDTDNENHLALQLMPNDVDFVGGQIYRFTLEVYMNSGLSDKVSREIEAQMLESAKFAPSANIETDPDEMVAYISPMCYDEGVIVADPITGEIDEEDFYTNLTQDVLLDVYRIETDGTFTAIETGLENTGYVTVTDPHPSLDYARYRIVATKITSGDIRTQDYFSYEMGVHALVLQWEESWNTVTDNSEVFSDDNDLSIIEGFKAMTNYTGNRLVLPWNIDMTENFDPDVALIEYIGREHPVSYYGTQLGQSASWSTDIVKYNYESKEYQDFNNNQLFQLRKLARYMGDVYVREPSGTGYWANVKVNWTQTHNEQVIPVSLEIKRVEGNGI